MNQPHGLDTEQLIAAYLDGTITDAQYDLFVERLHAQPALLERLAELSQLDRMLTDELSHTDRVELIRLESGDAIDAVEKSDDSGMVLSQLAALEAQAGEVEPIDLTDEIARRESEEKVRQLHLRRAQELRRAGLGGEGSRVYVIPQVVAWLGLAAAIGLVVWLGWPEPSSPSAVPRVDAVQPEQTHVIVARVHSGVDARWSGLSHPGQSRLYRNVPVTLDAGYAEVVFADGAAVIVQAPASFEPTGRNGMRLTAGRITATIPESAHGFTVATAGGLITDHGTEFGVAIQPGGELLAQTFTGLISLAPSDGAGGWDGQSPIDLRAGDAVVARSTGEVQRVEANETAFVREVEYTARQNAGDSPYHRWLAYSYELRRDPGLLAYYTFDHQDESPGALLNRSARSGSRMNGALGLPGDPMTIPRWVEGRFPEKGALRFGVVDQTRARAVVVEGFGGMNLGQSLTLAAWVRTPDAAEDAGGGTLLSLRDAPVRHLSFQLSLFLEGDPYANQIQFGTGNELDADRPNDSFRYSTPRPVAPGGWHLVAVVYEDGVASFYLDGRMVSRSEPVGPIAVTRPSAALLIGTDPYMPNFNRTSRVEAFMGDIDEVAIFDRPMSREEIDQMYQAGRPGR